MPHNNQQQQQIGAQSYNADSPFQVSNFGGRYTHEQKLQYATHEHLGTGSSRTGHMHAYSTPHQQQQTGYTAANQQQQPTYINSVNNQQGYSTQQMMQDGQQPRGYQIQGQSYQQLAQAGQQGQPYQQQGGQYAQSYQGQSGQGLSYQQGGQSQSYQQVQGGQAQSYQQQGGQQDQSQKQQQQQMKQQIKQQYQGQYSQLSTKDFNYLKDHLSWELLAAKKCYHYAGECKDQQVAGLIHQMGQMHEQHFNTLLQFFDPQNVQ